VVVLADDEPFGFVALAMPRGFSRFLLGSSDWGNAWDDIAVEHHLGGTG
jgi:hypothetical protein